MFCREVSKIGNRMERAVLEEAKVHQGVQFEKKKKNMQNFNHKEATERQRQGKN
jgi:hypothetical protein